ncbi:MAG TPA: hypothetical protein EYG89_03835 [Bacteroidia bacterium]|nr:hypothetical protein [Bacteroidia bacterium]
MKIIITLTILITSTLLGGIQDRYPSYKDIFKSYDIQESFIFNKNFIDFVNKNERRFRKNYISMLKSNKDVIFPTLVILSEELSSKYLNIYIPIIESSLKINNRSKTGATGLWQFITMTGRESGLIMNKYVDQRNDPILSTINGFKYLDKMINKTPNHKYLGLMAYNSGYGYMSRRANNNYDLSFLISNQSPIKKETKDYIKKFLLMAMIGENHRFINDPEIESIKDSSRGDFLIKIDLKKLRNFKYVSNKYNISKKILRKYNQQFKRKNPIFRYINIPSSYLN